MTNKRETKLESLPEVHHEGEGEKAEAFINAKDTIIAIKKELTGLEKREQGIEDTVHEMQDEGELEPATIESAVVAEEASVLRIENREKQLEAKKEQMEKLRKARNWVLLGMGALSGTDSFILALDRIGKFTDDEKGGLLLDHDERIQLIHRKTKLIKFASKVTKPFMPGWGKALLVGGEKVWEMTDRLNEKYETALKNGEDVSFKETGQWALEELGGMFDIEDLKNPEKIKEVGNLVIDFGKDLGGSAGSTFEKIGNLIVAHPEKASTVLVELFSSIQKGDYNIEEEEMLEEVVKAEKADDKEIATA